MPDLTMQVQVDTDELLKRIDEFSRPGSDHVLEAVHLVNADRQADYGSPADYYEGIARVWSGLLQQKLTEPLTAEEAALMMVGLKIQRQCMKPKRDNMVDAHGYLLVAAHCREDKR